ncbi:hypothetical protein [Arcanobacterium canis]
MFWRRDPEQIRRDLDDVKQQISENPLSGSAVVKASEVMERLKSEGREEEIDSQLAEQGLPNSEHVGKLVLQNSFTLARLNKKRRKLEKKLAAHS